MERASRKETRGGETKTKVGKNATKKEEKEQRVTES